MPSRFCFLFQSTLPVGGATNAMIDKYVDLIISIHAPRGGSDFCFCSDLTDVTIFQSTLPVGGATWDGDSKAWLDTNFNPRSPWGERR